MATRRPLISLSGRTREIPDGDTLPAAQVPGLDWSKIVTGKPTTLAGYGISDAAADSAVVHLAGAETITGAKAVTVSTNVDTPTTAVGGALALDSGTLTAARAHFGGNFNIQFAVQNATTNPPNMRGVQAISFTSTTGGNATAVGAMTGAFCGVDNRSDHATYNAFGTMYGSYCQMQLSGDNATATDTYGVFSQNLLSGSGASATKVFGVRSNISQSSTATAATAYGLYTDVSGTGITNKYGVYSASAVANYLAGGLRIGGTASAAETTGLQVSNGAIGYATGAGGTVTQATNKSTAVTINKVCGRITMNAAALANSAAVVFTVNNSTVESGDAPYVWIAGGTTAVYVASVTRVQNGSFNISVLNRSGSSLSEAVQVGFLIIKGVIS